MNVDPHPGRFRCSLQPLGTIWMRELWPLPTLRVAQKELDTIGTDFSGLANGIVLANMATE